VLEFAVGLAEGAEIGVLVIIASWERQVACGRQVLVIIQELAVAQVEQPQGSEFG
jgi:hypothetical protein